MPEATTTRLKLKKFGDLILWKQLIEHALVRNKAVILVTGEKKDDWWLKSDKLLVTALPALSKEFMSTVKQDFYLYSTDKFLLKANEYLKQDTSDNVVEEVRAINFLLTFQLSNHRIIRRYERLKNLIRNERMPCARIKFFFRSL